MTSFTSRTFPDETLQINDIREQIEDDSSVSGVSCMSQWEDVELAKQEEMQVPRTAGTLEQMMYGALAKLQWQREQEEEEAVQPPRTIDFNLDFDECDTSRNSQGLIVLKPRRGDPHRRHRRKRHKLALIAILLLLVVLGITAGVMLARADDDDNKTLEVTPSPTNDQDTVDQEPDKDGKIPQDDAGPVTTAASPTKSPTSSPTQPPTSSPISNPAPAPTQPPVQPTPPGEPVCFADRDELLVAIDEFLANPDTAADTASAKKYGYPMSNWCVDQVTSFEDAFSTRRNPNAANFNQDLSSWKTSAAVDMTGMFWGCENFDAPVGTWDVSQVRSMRDMFRNCGKFNQDLADWNVAQVRSMRNMFRKCTSFAPASLESWNVSELTDARGMFWAASSFNGKVSNWNVQNLNKSADMFRLAWSFEQDVSPWQMSSGSNVARMFYGLTNFSQNLCSWKTQLQANADVEDMFFGTACPVTTVLPAGGDDNNPRSLETASFCFDCGSS